MQLSKMNVTQSNARLGSLVTCIHCQYCMPSWLFSFTGNRLGLCFCSRVDTANACLRLDTNIFASHVLSLQQACLATATEHLRVANMTHNHCSSHAAGSMQSNGTSTVHQKHINYLSLAPNEVLGTRLLLVSASIVFSGSACRDTSAGMIVEALLASCPSICAQCICSFKPQIPAAQLKCVIFFVLPCQQAAHSFLLIDQHATNVRCKLAGGNCRYMYLQI